MASPESPPSRRWRERKCAAARARARNLPPLQRSSILGRHARRTALLHLQPLLSGTYLLSDTYLLSYTYSYPILTPILHLPLDRYRYRSPSSAAVLPVEPGERAAARAGHL